MRIETQEAVASIYNKTAKQLKSARLARNNATTEQNRLMLSGKVKAYTDIVCLIENRYGKKMVLPK